MRVRTEADLCFTSTLLSFLVMVRGFGVTFLPTTRMTRSSSSSLANSSSPDNRTPLEDFFLSDDKPNDDLFQTYNDDSENKLGIPLQLIPLSDTKNADTDDRIAVKDSISDIVEQGLNELSMLKDRLHRENNNPYDQDKVLWNREYERQEAGLRLKVDELAVKFLKDTEEQRQAVHESAMQEALDREMFPVRAEAASHGRAVSATENSLSRLLVKAKVALKGLLDPGSAGGAWNNWDEWTDDYNDNDKYTPQK